MTGLVFLAFQPSFTSPLCLPLMVKATMPSILNTIRNFFMRRYGSEEEVVTICVLCKRWFLCSYPFSPQLYPPPPHPPPIWILCQNSLPRELKIRFVGRPPSIWTLCQNSLPRELKIRYVGRPPSIWTLCQNSLPRELKIRFVGFVL